MRGNPLLSLRMPMLFGNILKDIYRNNVKDLNVTVHNIKHTDKIKINYK